MYLNWANMDISCDSHGDDKSTETREYETGKVQRETGFFLKGLWLSGKGQRVYRMDSWNRTFVEEGHFDMGRLRSGKVICNGEVKDEGDFYHGYLIRGIGRRKDETRTFVDELQGTIERTDDHTYKGHFCSSTVFRFYNYRYTLHGDGEKLYKGQWYERGKFKFGKLINGQLRTFPNPTQVFTYKISNQGEHKELIHVYDANVAALQDKLKVLTDFITTLQTGTSSLAESDIDDLIS